MIRVLFLTLYPETMPSSRYRVYQYLPYLQQAGFEAAVLPAIPEPWFSLGYYSRSKLIRTLYYGLEALENLVRLRRSQSYDVVFVQKGILSTNLRGFERLLDGFESRLVFDLDDLVYGRSVVEFGRPFLRRWQDDSQTEKISARSRAIVAGNSYLKTLALQHNRNVHLVPTPVDTERFRPAPKKPKSAQEEIVIGWIGIGGGVAYVRLLERVFQELSRRYRIRLKLVTRPDKKPFAIKGVPVQLVPWSRENEVREMEEFDIGMMPLPDDEWVRGKCGFKLLQYMAMGIPSVASRLGVNSEMVEEGIDGFLANEPEEWVEKLSQLIEDSNLRCEMGGRAREKAVEKYSLSRWSPVLASLLKEVGGP